MEATSRNGVWFGRRHQKVSKMNMVCLVISGIALVLQIVSVATNYWATLSVVDVGVSRVSINLGLWKVCSCFFGTCVCNGYTSAHSVQLNQVVLAGAIPVILLTVLQETIALCYELKEGWRIFKFVSSIVSATCLVVGLALFAKDYETAINYVTKYGMLKIGWSFILCAVANAAMAIVTICQCVDICRKRHELSIQSGDTRAIVPQDVLSLEVDSAPPAYTREIPTGQVVYYADTQQTRN